MLIAIGNFDGVHIGHQAVVRRAVEMARARGLASAVLTFNPHPAAVLNPAAAPKLIMTPTQRLRHLEALGVDDVLVVPFSREIAAQTPEQFAAQYLSIAQVVLVGGDFRFGHRRVGDLDTLRSLGFEVVPIEPVSFRGVRASSTEIRRLVAASRVNRAARLLGRPFSLVGPVVRGHGIGSKQTVPTLNLAAENELLPADGVYVTRVAGVRSITNIGMRPTFDGDARTVETFLLDPPAGDIPERIEVEFLRFVRPERKFGSPEELKAQIMRDVAHASRVHARLARLGV